MAFHHCGRANHPSELGDPFECPPGMAGHLAKETIEAAAAAVRNKSAVLGVFGLPVGRAPGYIVLACPLGDGLALRDRNGELILLGQGDFFFGYGTPWR
jgi:hypothetical protein